MTVFSRRHLFSAIAAAAITPVVATAHNGHDHGASTPSASPQADSSHHDHDQATNSGTGAVYLTITNTGDTPDLLESATTEAARLVQVHSMTMSDGVMKMEEQAGGLDIPAGETVTFEPGGWHLMLIDLQHDLSPGSVLDIALVFEHAGEVTLAVPVQWEAPTGDDPVVTGDLTIEHAWARPAPMLTAGSGMATPAATPTD